LFVVKYTDPATEFKVSSDDDAATFITVCHDLKEQLCPFPFEGDITPFVTY